MVGDILLIMGVWNQLMKFDEQRDFYLLNTPEESKQVAPALSQAPHALFSVLTMVVLMITGIVPNVIAALIACLMLGKFRCVDMKSAYQSIHLPSIVLIVGMMPFSTKNRRGEFDCTRAALGNARLKRAFCADVIVRFHGNHQCLYFQHGNRNFGNADCDCHRPTTRLFACAVCYDRSNFRIGSIYDPSVIACKHNGSRPRWLQIL